MAGSIAVGFSFFVVGDGTTDPVTVSLLTDPIYLFSVDPLTPSSTGSNPLSQAVSPRFDIVKTPPTGAFLGEFTATSGSPTFALATGTPGSGGNFSSVAVSGYDITVTPAIGFTGVFPAVGILTF